MTDQEIQDLMFHEVYLWTDAYDLGERCVLIGYDKFSEYQYCGRFKSETKPIWFKYIDHIRPEPKKRLMAPAELCGGWVVFEEGRAMVVGWQDEEVLTIHDSFTVEEIHAGDHAILGWARSVNGEIESVEVDDE